MSEQPRTPMRFVFSFSSKSAGDPPDVLVEDADGTAWMEIYEEPVLTGLGDACEYSDARNEAGEETGTYSWEAEDWDFGPFAKRLQAIMREAGLVQ